MVSLHVCCTVCQSFETGSYTDFDTPFSGWFSYSGVSLLPCPSPSYFPVVLVVQVSSYKSCAKEAQIFYQRFNFCYSHHDCPQSKTGAGHWQSLFSSFDPLPDFSYSPEPSKRLFHIVQILELLSLREVGCLLYHIRKRTLLENVLAKCIEGS